MNSEPRFNKGYLIIGAKGKGKTFFMLNENTSIGPLGIIHRYMRSREYAKILIVDNVDHPDYRDMGWKIIEPRYIPALKKGIKRLKINTPNEFLQLFQILADRDKPFMNGMIIFEDASKYLKKEKKIPDELINAIVNIKQLNVDLFFMYHGFRYSHPDIWGLMDRLQLFKTPDSPEIRESVINEYDDVCAAHARIKQNEFEFYSESVILQ